MPRCKPEQYTSIDRLFDGRSDAQVRSDSEGDDAEGDDADMQMARIVHDMVND